MAHLLGEAAGDLRQAIKVLRLPDRTGRTRTASLAKAEKARGEGRGARSKACVCVCVSVRARACVCVLGSKRRDRRGLLLL